jgi:hypothetical protein
MPPSSLSPSRYTDFYTASHGENEGSGPIRAVELVSSYIVVLLFTRSEEFFRFSGVLHLEGNLCVYAWAVREPPGGQIFRGAVHLTYLPTRDTLCACRSMEVTTVRRRSRLLVWSRRGKALIGYASDQSVIR